MKIFRSFFFFALALAFCGCNPCQYYAHRCTPVESRVDSIWRFDTVILERIIRDTVQIVSLPQENAADAALCPDTAKAETSLAYAWAYLNAGKIFLGLANKENAPLQVPKITETAEITIFATEIPSCRIKRPFCPPFVPRNTPNRTFKVGSQHLSRVPE